MADNSEARRFIWFGGLIIVAGLVWYGGQAIVSSRQTAVAKFQAYLECINKASRVDWAKYGITGEHPSASEICGKLAS